jgi:hypothetical protein
VEQENDHRAAIVRIRTDGSTTCASGRVLAKDRMHTGLVEYLEGQRRRRKVAGENVEAAALTLFAAVHCLAILERVGVHGGRFDDAVIRVIVRSLWTGLAPKKQRGR